MAFRISEDCWGCGVCRKMCPWSAVHGERKKRHLIDPVICRECGTCWYACPRCAVEDAEGYRRKKEVKTRIPKVSINRGLCAGCKNCLLNCEQGAIHYKRGLLFGYCMVEETLCVGCGGCLALCASGCISLA